MYPSFEVTSELQRWSNRFTDPYYNPDAVSDLEYYGEYFDTLTDVRLTGINPWSNRTHIPIGVRIIQHSYSWSNAANEDFVLMEYLITNEFKGADSISVGIYVDGDIFHIVNGQDGYQDDLAGSVVLPPQSNLDEAVIVGYLADNDGDPSFDVFDFTSATSVLGAALLGPPEYIQRKSFNTWRAHGNPNLDWGPWLQSSDYVFPTGSTGVPVDDRSKYFVMTNDELDYDQLEWGIDYSGEGWLPPSPAAPISASGGDARFLLSFGPVQFDSRGEIRFAAVFAGGEHVHTNPAAFEDLFDPDSPYAYKNQLDFSDLKANVHEARSQYIRMNIGDINWDGEIDIDDAVSLISYVYLQSEAPPYPPVADINCDGKLSLIDIVSVISYLFRGGQDLSAYCGD